MPFVFECTTCGQPVTVSLSLERSKDTSAVFFTTPCNACVRIEAEMLARKMIADQEEVNGGK